MASLDLHPYAYHVLALIEDQSARSFGHRKNLRSDAAERLHELGLTTSANPVEALLTDAGRDFYDSAPELLLFDESRPGHRHVEVWVKGDWTDSAQATQMTDLRNAGTWRAPDVSAGSRGAGDPAYYRRRAAAIARACDVADEWAADTGKPIDAPVDGEV